MILLILKSTIMSAVPLTIFVLSLFARSSSVNLEHIVESVLSAAVPYMTTTAGAGDIPDIPYETQVERPPSSAEMSLQA